MSGKDENPDLFFLISKISSLNERCDKLLNCGELQTARVDKLCAKIAENTFAQGSIHMWQIATFTMASINFGLLIFILNR